MSSTSFFATFFLWLTKWILGIIGRPNEEPYAERFSIENLLRSTTSLTLWRYTDLR
jgi:hypothetical protein